MARFGSARALILLTTLLLGQAAAVAKVDEYQCRRDGLMRRVQLSGAPADRPMPCEVVYWKDSEQPGGEQVLWNAKSNPQYCEEHARIFVERLRGWGWQCERVGEPTALPPPDRPERLNAQRPRAAARGDGAVLAKVIARTLNSLKNLYPGDFQAEIADYGDLNGDGFEDAVVVITHSAAGRDQVRYLVAYLFDGEDFRSAASRDITGPPEHAWQGAVERIVDGAILVNPEPPGPAPAPCCRPRPPRPVAYGLREGKLVELN